LSNPFLGNYFFGNHLRYPSSRGVSTRNLKKEPRSIGEAIRKLLAAGRGSRRWREENPFQKVEWETEKLTRFQSLSQAAMHTFPTNYALIREMQQCLNNFNNIS
jgi:hypothetical protein